MGYNGTMKDRSAIKGSGIKSAEPIVKHIYSGMTETPSRSMDPPESFLKGNVNSGSAPMSRVFNEVK